MTITESNRHQMYDKLRQILGDEDATTLMEHLPPVGWADIATRRDLDQQSTLLRSELHNEIGQLGADLRSEMAELGTDLRGEITGLREEIHGHRGETGQLGTDLRGETSGLRADVIRLEGAIVATEARLVAMIHRELAAFTRTFIIAMIGAMATIASLSFAAAHLT